MATFLRSLAGLSLLLVAGLLGCRVVFLFGGKISSIQVTPANPSIRVGERQQFVAIVTFRDGTFRQVATEAALWSSSNPAVATISSTGLARGVGVGTATITATIDAVSGSTTLTVTLTTPAVVAVEGGPGKLFFTLAANSQRFGYVANALDETISVYRLDGVSATMQLNGSFSVEPGKGPVWMAVHPSGKFLYVLNHLSKDISAFVIDPSSGQLMAVPGSPFSSDGSPWDISVDANGGCVYVTNFASEELSIYSVEPATGVLNAR